MSPSPHRARSAARVLLAVLMLGIGALHFVADEIFVQIVQPFLPAPMLLVWVSGVIEIALGAALLHPRTRRAAGWGLVSLYVAVFPANIYMAVENVQIVGLPAWAAQPSQTSLWLRLPFQIVFIAWALWVSRPATTLPESDAKGRVA